MRQSFTFVFALVFLIFPGCSRNAAPAQDFAYQYHKAQNVQTLQESDSGYYFGRMRHLTYIDKSTLAEVPLCAKPNCSHGDDTDCDGFFYFSASSDPYFLYSGGKLYCALNPPEKGMPNALVRMDPDGQNRKTVCTFPEDETISRFLLHRGNFYVQLTAFDEAGLRRTSIRKVSLDGKRQTEFLSFSSDESVSLDTAFDRFLYVSCFSKDEQYRMTSRTLIRLDCETGERLDIPAAEDGWVCENVTFAGGKMYVLQHESDAYDTESDPPKRLYRCEPDGSDPEFIVSGNGTWGSDGTLLYSSRPWGSIDGDDTESSPALVIFDAEGRELERLDLATLPCGRPGMLSVFPTFGSDVLFSAVCGDRVFLYRFPKSAIGSGALPLEPLGSYNWY
ncbi:MAG: hypothetical protein SOW68_04390 [Eubacteriales bacterium]|nr:hypothetical protein [Eubacteriales bacterium]